MEGPETQESERVRRAATVLGWVAGGLLGLLVNYGLFLWVGPGYPTVPTTFAFFIGGAFLGMAVSDRLGKRSVAAMGIAAGVMIAATLVVAALVVFHALQ